MQTKPISLRDKDEETLQSETTPEKSSLKEDPQPNESAGYQSGNDPVTGATESQNNFKCKKYATKVFIGIVLLTFVLVCTVFSKLTLVSLTDRLRSVTAVHFNESQAYLYDDNQGEITLIPFLVENDLAVSLYWQLLHIVIVPNIISFLRSLAFGVLGKTSKNFPWPGRKAVLIVSAYY